MEPAGSRERLLEAVDYGSMILGDMVRQTVYGRIENDHGLRREEIPDRLEAFKKAPESMVGVGAKTVRRLIAKNLYQRLGLNSAHPNWTAVEHVSHTRATLESNQVRTSS